MAENERLKGNEYMKSKDYREAVNSYTKSIDFDANQAFTFANRAMAYLKMKSYRYCNPCQVTLLNLTNLF